MCILVLPAFAAESNDDHKKSMGGLPRVENKLDGLLDYSKNELQLFLKGVDESKIAIGSIGKDGTVRIDLPKLDIKEMYESTETKPPSVEKIFRMNSCTGREWDAASKYTDAYPYMYNSISVELYGLQVGLLVPASSEKVLGNNLYRESDDDYRYHNKPLHLGNEYYFYNFNKDLTFKEKCVSSKNDNWADVSNIEVKKGWSFIKESLLSIDRNSDGQLIHLGVSYENAKIDDADIKWYLKPLFSSIPEEVMVLAKKMYMLTPLSKNQLMDWVPDTLGDFKLASKVYGKLPDDDRKNHSTNNVHLIYKHKEKKIDMYVIDTAKFVEDLADAKMIYDMDASFNKEKKRKKTPYVAQKSDEETHFVYIHKDRIVINASASNMEADEMWSLVEKMDLNKLVH